MKEEPHPPNTMGNPTGRIGVGACQGRTSNLDVPPQLELPLPSLMLQYTVSVGTMHGVSALFVWQTLLKGLMLLQITPCIFCPREKALNVLAQFTCRSAAIRPGEYLWYVIPRQLIVRILTACTIASNLSMPWNVDTSSFPFKYIPENSLCYFDESHFFPFSSLFFFLILRNSLVINKSYFGHKFNHRNLVLL